ncbi:MAG: hypothetical protein OEY63_01265 [Gemmatimonadota bacterium]|nr:hypothetical protein [Gemmatimonadota bacterium]
MNTPSRSRSTDTMAVGCVLLFLAPFALVGVGAFVFAVASLVNGNLAEAGFGAVFALGFGGTAFGVGFTAVRSAKGAGRINRLREAHPEEPWLWNPEWASGQIRSGGKTLVVVLWFVAVLWNAISGPGIFAVFANPDEGPAIFAFLIFPVVGLAIVAVAIHQTVSYLRYGVSIFEMAHVPGVIGRGLGGIIYARLPFSEAKEVNLTLSCVNRVVTGSGKNRSTRETVLWQDSLVVSEFVWDGERSEASIPVVFRIPSDVPPCNEDDQRDLVLWRLTAKADVPGVDYSASFSVPVFKTSESEEALEEAPPIEVMETERPWNSGKITVRDTVRGLEVDFPWARHKGAAIFMTLFGVGWTGTVAALWVTAPLLFALVFAFFDLFILWFATGLWFRRSTVLADGMTVTVKKGIALFEKTFRFDKDDIEIFDAKRGMRLGDELFYDLQLKLKNGKTMTVGSSIRSEEDARRIIQALQEMLGLEAKV